MSYIVIVIYNFTKFIFIKINLVEFYFAMTIFHILIKILYVNK